MADDQGQRTEQATPKRLQEARQRGQVARSGEVGPAVSVVAAAGFLSWMGPTWAGSLSALVPTIFGELQSPAWQVVDAEHFITRVIGHFVMLAAPIVLTIAAVVIGTNLLQVGFVLTGHPLKPDWNRVSVVNGFRNLFSGRAFVDLAKAPLKLALLGAIAYLTVRSELATLMTVAGVDPFGGVKVFGGLALTLMWRIGVAHVAIAALDYGYQRWAHQRQLRMTKDEVRDEMRQAEGDPQIRARFRSLHRQYAMRRMMAAVPTADVVVTNPTHLAIALKYEAGSMKAPKVVAKGARLVAQRIREAARAAGVPVVEHKPLAQALYKAVPIGGEIPSRLYRAVAEILAYVWALHRRLR
ncbi:MAG: flagellar biosynthesis protein FlhB [Candidatus Rokuibacteriota bacterium]|nr:MAG: flagellar biosynthesis protein FlhB [Candidatus Rokubacteria bacterium]